MQTTGGKVGPNIIFNAIIVLDITTQNLERKDIIYMSITE